jgi:hypothetical protein
MPLIDNKGYGKLQKNNTPAKPTVTVTLRAMVMAMAMATAIAIAFNSLPAMVLHEGPLLN